MLLHKIKMVLIRCVFRVFSDSAGLQLAKRFNMEKQAIKELMYGGISELMKNRRYYYQSSVGQSYSHWTEEGKMALEYFMKEMTKYIYDAEQADVDRRAKQQTLDALKS